MSKKMLRIGYKPISFVATDYALAIWSINEVKDVNIVLNEDLMLDDLYEWVRRNTIIEEKF